jgi:glyoxylase-like metal-dependent hydrolase (beta-lactamase superfamily II)
MISQNKFALLSLVLSLCLVSSFAFAQRTSKSIQLTPIKVSPHVYYFQGESGVASAANQGYMSNAGFVVTNAGVVVYDALATPVLGEAMIAAIKKITSQPIKKVIIGHYHADHIYGLQAFKKIGAELIAHENGKLYLSSELAQQRLEQRRAELFPWVDDKTKLLPADVWLNFSDKKPYSFSLGGVNFQIIDSSGAHSSEDVLLFVENEKVLFAGDIYFSGRIPFVGNADSRVWLQTLDRLLDVKPTVVVPGHGKYSRNTIEDMQLTKTYLEFLREKMGNAVQDLIGFEEVYQQTDWSRFENLAAFKAANRLNAFGTYILMEKESLERK